MFHFVSTCCKLFTVDKNVLYKSGLDDIILDKEAMLLKSNIDKYLKRQLFVNVFLLIFNWLFFGGFLVFMLNVNWIILFVIYMVVFIVDIFIIKSIIDYSRQNEYQQLHSMVIMLIIFNLPCALHLFSRFRGKEFIIRDSDKYYQLIGYKPDSEIIIPTFEYLLRFRDNQSKIDVKAINEDDDNKLLSNLLTSNQIFFIIPLVLTLVLIGVLYALFGKELGIILPLEFLTIFYLFILSYIEVLIITLFENLTMRVEVREKRIANAIALFNSFSFRNINIFYNRKLNDIYSSFEITKNDTIK